MLFNGCTVSLYHTDLDSGRCSFRREAELHFALRHPNIVEMYAYNDAWPLCIIMERMNQSLYDFLGLDLELGISEKIDLLIGVAEASISTI